MAGRVAFVLTPGARPVIRSGPLRALAGAARQRRPALPAVSHFSSPHHRRRARHDDLLPLPAALIHSPFSVILKIAMNFLRRLPAWVWWLLAIAAIAGLAVIFVIRTFGPSLPPGLVERREAVGRILDNLNKIQDVDIRPLAELETKKEYANAVSLVERALSANSAYEAEVSSLVEASRGLTTLAAAISSAGIAVKARDAFALLTKFAEAEKKFYEDRRSLYQITRSYYADLAAKKKAPIPEGLPAMVDTVNADFAQAQEIRRQFAAALKAFDDAVAERGGL